MRVRVRVKYSLYLPEISLVSPRYLVPVAALEVEQAAAEEGQVGQPQQATQRGQEDAEAAHLVKLRVGVRVRVR